MHYYFVSINIFLIDFEFLSLKLEHFLHLHAFEGLFFDNFVEILDISFQLVKFVFKFAKHLVCVNYFIYNIIIILYRLFLLLIFKFQIVNDLAVVKEQLLLIILSSLNFVLNALQLTLNIIYLVL